MPTLEQIADLIALLALTAGHRVPEAECADHPDVCRHCGFAGDVHSSRCPVYLAVVYGPVDL